MAPQITLQFFLSHFHVSVREILECERYCMCIQAFMTFVSCLVLTCWSNTGHSCQVLLNLLFIRGSSCLCIGVICLFRLYALRHINMGTSCIMNSLGTLMFPLCLFTFVFGIYDVVVSSTRQLVKFVMTFLVLNNKFHASVGFQGWMLFSVCVCVCVLSSPVVTAAKVWSWPS
jgi:hypothetical protein